MIMQRTEHEDSVISHLNELRTRILYGLLTLAIGMVVAWMLYPTCYAFLSKAVQQSVAAHGGTIIFSNPIEPFMVRMTVSAVLGLVLALPVILWQFWLFIHPGLLPHERRVVAPIIPVVCLLFLFGAAIAYVMMPMIMAFFLCYTPAGVHPLIDFQQSITFPLKIMVAFGLGFQLPILVLTLVWLGVLSPALLRTQWRTAIFAVGVLAALITPTVDPLSWALLFVPLAGLYFVTLWFAERIHRAGRSAPAGESSDS